MKRFLAATLACVLIASSEACNEKPLSYGDPNSIIAVMAPDQWEVVSQDVYDALEQTITTVRSEKTFTVTYQAPLAEFWDRLRRFRQMLVVGSRSDVWVQEVLEASYRPITENGVHQVYNVWSSGQTITLVLMDDGWTSEDLSEHLADVNDLLDGQYRSYAQNRMYFSGVDSALADTLRNEAGFLMYLPEVYRWRRVDSVFVFRNDNPDPSELIREVRVTWLTPAPGRLDTEQILAWRATLTQEDYSEPQEILLDGLTERTFVHEGNEASQVNAQWRNPPEWAWPAGGPFMTRSVTCDSQDRTYLLDAWLYAPGKEKYEYMIQLETLLDSFRCTS